MKLLPILLGFSLLPFLSFSQSIDDTFDDGISGGKNILGVNVGALIYNELDLRYSRLIEITNGVQWNLQLGIGIPAGDYKTPLYLTDFDPRAYADFEWEEFTEAQISSSPRYTAGLHTFHAYTFPSTNIGIGGGWNLQYRQLNFTSSINDETYTQDMFAFGLAPNFTAEPFERVVLMLQGGVGVELTLFEDADGSDLSFSDEPFVYYFGQLQVGYKF